MPREQRPRSGRAAARRSRRRAAAPSPSPALPGPSRFGALVLLLLLLASTAVVYLPVGDFDFVSYDDPQYVSESPLVLQGLRASGVRAAFTGIHHGNWHPLTTLTYMLEVELFGVGPAAPHRLNLALHLLATLLLFLFLRAATGAAGRSLAVAALFALHPLHVESVAWISQRKDVLSAVFALASGLAWVRYVAAPGPTRYLAVLVLFALGLLSKAMLVTWPFVLLLLDVWPLRRFEAAPRRQAVSWRLALLEKLPLLAVSVLVSVLTVWAQLAGGAVKTTDMVPLGSRVANALTAYVVYLGKLAWPVDLAVLYPYPASFPAWEVLGSGAVLLALCAGALRLRQSHPFLLVGWFWYLGMLVPVIGLVQVGAQAYADRYTYLPSIGLFVAIVWAAGSAVEASRRAAAVAIGAVVAAVLALAAVTSRQVDVWEDSVLLYGHALAVTPENPIMHNNLGIALAKLGRLDEAIEVYEAGLPIPSNMHHVLAYNAGQAMADRGDEQRALKLFERTLQIDPEHAEARFHRARTLAHLGRLDEARGELELVVEQRPAEAEPRVELALTLGRLGRTHEARQQLEKAVALQPLYVDARINLAVALLKTGEHEAAIDELDRVLALKPGHEAALRYRAIARERADAPPGSQH